MAFSEITTRWLAKCHKCDREIKVGWTVLYDSDIKKVYCKPCGSIITGKQSEPLTPVRADNSLPDYTAQFDDVISRIAAELELIGMLDTKLTAIIELINEQSEKPAEAKSKKPVKTK